MPKWFLSLFYHFGFWFDIFMHSEEWESWVLLEQNDKPIQQKYSDACTKGRNFIIYHEQVEIEIQRAVIPSFLQNALKYYSLVFDAVYTPKITRLLKEAEESGATIVTGLEMFMGQAYGQYENFTGLPGKLNVKV